MTVAAVMAKRVPDFSSADAGAGMTSCRGAGTAGVVPGPCGAPIRAHAQHIDTTAEQRLNNKRGRSMRTIQPQVAWMNPAMQPPASAGLHLGCDTIA